MSQASSSANASEPPEPQAPEPEAHANEALVLYRHYIEFFNNFTQVHDDELALLYLRNAEFEVEV